MPSRHLLTTPAASHGEQLQKMSPYFFGDLNWMLREFVILQVCKLTDPATDARGNENLAVEFLVRNSDLSADVEEAAEFRGCADRIEQFRSKLKPARDKIISHSDRRSILDGRPLGGADMSAWEDFWLDLQVFVNLLWKRHFGDASLCICGVMGSSDAVAMLQALRTFAASGLPFTA